MFRALIRFLRPVEKPFPPRFTEEEALEIIREDWPYENENSVIEARGQQAWGWEFRTVWKGEPGKPPEGGGMWVFNKFTGEMLFSGSSGEGYNAIEKAKAEWLKKYYQWPQ